ncbi:MAG: parallel beta-helix domain-containing protein, partial [Oceanococcaceae bacterium]
MPLLTGLRHIPQRPLLFLCLALASLLGACTQGGRPLASAATDSGPRLFQIEPGPEAEEQALKAFFQAREGDTIAFSKGQFNFGNGLLMFNARGVTIQGAGMEDTILSFAGSANKEGIFVSHTQGLTIEDLTVEDMPGDGVKVSDSAHVLIRRVKVRWTNADPEHPNYDASRESWAANGAYAFYPVLSRDLILEDSISIGSSDVGFYIGQSQRVIVRNNLAYHNVQGYEFENTDDSEMHDNLARDNAGGFLAVDLPGRTRYGDKNRFYRNVATNNNIDNFAPKGTIAAAVPRGTGFIVLATDQLEIFDNEFSNNDTLGLVIVGYNLVDSSRDPQFDYYAEGIHIHSNRFANNGTNPQLPNLGPEDLPDPTSNPSLLPLLIMLKNFGQTAHIVWDGYTDTLNPDCDYPQGTPSDERGKPQYTPEHPAPDCGAQENGNPIRYNAYKFDANGELRKPENWICIQNNSFEDGLVPTPEFVNFGGTIPAPIGGDQDAPIGSRDQTPHQCTLPSLPQTVVRPYQPGEAGPPAPSEEAVAALCRAGPSQAIHRAALDFDCPQLADYGLFSDPQDPRSAPREGGMPFDLTTPLFSDYATKYRTIFLPPGSAARYDGQASGPNAHVDFPVGTVIAKTFAFPHAEGEEVVETRLLIKRQTPNGVFWQGLPYRWGVENGERVARLAIAGAKASVRWDYEDPNPEVIDASGQRKRY